MFFEFKKTGAGVLSKTRMSGMHIPSFQRGKGDLKTHSFSKYNI